ncbi:MAG TPA: putative PEP-binding protein [Verrucomicrobiae bacterium]|nr:putative PEP-binding protein [Verrucomicrobiae bacterium]
MTSCQWLYQIETGQEAIWGTEAAALAAVAKAGVPVLPGFVIAREVSFAFFMAPNVRARILKATKGLSVRKPELFAGAAKEIREIILTTPLPPEARKVFGAYMEELEDQLVLEKGKGLPLTLIAQGVGRQVHHGTPASLNEADKFVRQLYALSFTEQALYGRFMNEESIVPAPYPVLVQYAPEGQLSGLAQQYDSLTHDGTVITITVAHHEHPGDKHHAAADTYRIDAKSLHPLSREELSHTWAAKKRGAHVSPKHVHADQRLNERQLRLLARFVRRSQEAFDQLQVFHWQLFLDGVVVSGVEPMALEGANPGVVRTGERLPLLIGHSVNVGTARGPIRVIASRGDWKTIQDGDVVVVEQIAEKDIPLLAGVAALITESGHHTSCEAVAAKRLGIPAVSATGNARHLVRTGQLVTVDGTHGAVYAGRLPQNELVPHNLVTTLPITGTKIYAALDDALLATPQLLQDSDGIGMLRGEFILRVLGVHPHEVLHQGMSSEYVDLLAEGVERAARAAGSKPVIYQLHDLAEHSFHGWKSWRRERHEPNQLIGYRGTQRLLSEPEILELELKALSRLQKKGFDNISIMLPMVRSLEEVKQMQKILAKLAPAGLSDRLWVRVETPALTIKADALSKLDLEGVLFDAPALATLITGMDADNHQVGHNRDQADPAVQDALSYAIATCRKAGLSTAVVAEHEQLRPELVECIIKAGVTALCVRPQECTWLHGLVASVEQRMLLDHLLEE